MTRRLPSLCLGLFCATLQTAGADGLCDQAAAAAAAQSGVPEKLLRAITRVETGRDGQPWPWTLNIDGQAHWLPDRQAALAAAQAAVAAGAQQIDLGCFQLNLRWQGAAFPDLATMLDPDANASQAARFLTELRDELGDWRAAAAAYHSRRPHRGAAYLAALEAAHGAETPGAVPEAPRLNSFPLLLAGEIGPNGSLVPLTPGLSPLIGAP